MTVGDAPARTVGPTGERSTDLTAAVRDLLAGVAARPWGQASPSVYETGRLVALAPWLTGHRRRVDFLRAAQRPDGGWGGPDGYALIPTLSATDAIVTVLRRAGEDAGRIGEDVGVARPDLARTAARGLSALSALLHRLDGAAIPDLPAADLIAPFLIESINDGMTALGGAAPGGGAGWAGRLCPPAGLDGARLAAVRAMLAGGAALPEKLLHALEVAGGAARGLRAVRPGRTGTVGASPAATAAWLGGPEPPAARDPARRFLEAVVDQCGGPVPCGLPITVFERAWVLAGLARVGLAQGVPPELVASLRGALSPGGTPAGEGLPADADTTSVALYALGLLGVDCRPDGLWAFQQDRCFRTWPGEDGFSVTTNAHVLEAFGLYAERHPDGAGRYTETVTELSALLRDHQRDDGAWTDRWHASPYYATACCALALDRFGGAGARTAVRRAVRWVIDTQRPDGSWGRWTGTQEETAYAVHILSLAQGSRADARHAAVAGAAYLKRRPDLRDDIPLWHDKDLYTPVAIVRSAVLAALCVAQCDQGGRRAVKASQPQRNIDTV